MPDPDRAVLGNPEQARGSDSEQRPEPLSAADRGMAHRGVKPVAAVAAVGKQLPEQRIDRGRNARRLAADARRGAIHQFQLPSNGAVPARLAVGAERDPLDPRLRRLQPRFAVALQPVAFLVELDRLVERRFALLQHPDDLLEPRKRVLETQLKRRLLSVHHPAMALGPPRIKLKPS